jgi:undecaprenyl diphosphate synthase
MERSELEAPNHVAIILDGNGRWAKRRMLPRKAGHVAGAKTVEKICEDAYDLGVNYLTVYAFSTENWKRPQDEVDALMKLLRQYLKDCIKRSTKNNMCVKVIGDITPLEEDLKQTIRELEKATADNTGLHFQVALNYGSRDEMLRGIKNLCADVKEGKITEEEITEDTFAAYLDTKGIPEPDLLIRTSGEKRLSNFLLWQLAYTEFYFTDVMWPDFDKEELQKAITHYNGRNRRYGGV